MDGVGGVAERFVPEMTKLVRRVLFGSRATSRYREMPQEYVNSFADRQPEPVLGVGGMGSGG